MKENLQNVQKYLYSTKNICLTLPCDGSQPSRIAKWTSYKKPVGQIYTKTDWRLLLGRGEEGLVAGGGENLHNIGSGQLQPGQVRGRGTLGQGSPLSTRNLCTHFSSEINMNP